MVLSSRTPTRGPSRTTSDDPEHGAILIIAALSLTALCMLAAFVVDLGNARQMARNHQGSADAASLAASQDLPVSASNSAKALIARNTARSYVAESLNGTASGPTCASQTGNTCSFTVKDATVDVTTPVSASSVNSTAPDYNLVRVRVCNDAPAILSKVMDFGPTRVCRSATARNVQVSAGVGIGIISLNPSASCAIAINGNNTVTVSGGAVLANSVANPAICGSSQSGCGSFTLNAALVAASGAVADCVEGRTNGAIVENADAVADPFAGLPDTVCSAPAATACNNATPSVPSAVGVCNSGTMRPGYFATGCNLGGGNGTTQMLPGVYWFNGTFDPRNYDVRCATCNQVNGGVLMYFYAGSLSHTGNGTINVLPYQPGQLQGALYAGLSVYQRRSNTTAMVVGGTTGSGLGSIYAKGAVINLHGNVVRSVNGIIVGDRIDFNGNTTTTVVPPLSGPQTDPVLDIGLEN